GAEGEGAQSPKRPVLFQLHIRPGLKLSRLAVVATVDVRFDRFGLVAGALRVVVPVDEANDLDVVGRALAAHLERDRLAGANGQRIRVSDDLHRAVAVTQLMCPS